MDKKDLQMGLSLIQKDLGIDETVLSLSATAPLTETSILKRLTQLVDHLLSHDFRRLINVLYRIDIPEEKLKQALASDEENAPAIIARMILEREMQKVKFRKQYGEERS